MIFIYNYIIIVIFYWCAGLNKVSYGNGLLGQCYNGYKDFVLVLSQQLCVTLLSRCICSIWKSSFRFLFKLWSTGVAQLGERLTSAQVMIWCSWVWAPCWALCWQLRAWSLLQIFVSLSHCPSPAHAVSLLSLKNK